MNKRFVMFTGGKNNSGDHLIKKRAVSLLSWLRPEVELIDMDGWRPLNDDQLEIVNNSSACLLTGGPALHHKMHPSVYALRKNLDEIKTPIITMGIGWHSPEGSWDNTHNYSFSDKSLALLERINASGFISSVRDYHTLNALQSNGFNNFVMTGCPALYSKNHLNSHFSLTLPILNIGFSLGVSLKTSKKMYEQMQDVLMLLRNVHKNAKITVAFHHSPGQEYLAAHGSNNKLFIALNKYKAWLDKNGFNYKDISGTAENLVDFYLSMDMHIGYRVHAHIFMNSISKPSILINEDGRGKALEKVIGGATLDAYKKVNTSTFMKVLHKASINIDNFECSPNFIQDLEFLIKYEEESGVKYGQPRKEIDRHFKIMEKFIKQLP